MRRAALLLTLGLFGVLICANAAHADVHPPHWTDGTTYHGTTDYGPPPLPAEWAGEPCHSDLLIDPPTVVFVTVHAFENDGEFDSEVVPYMRTLPDKVHAPGAFIDGHQGYIDLTWNIGTGRSEKLFFDCAPHPTTTTSTTVAPTTSTTVAAERTTVPRLSCFIPEGCDTTTTSTTSTTVVMIGTPATLVAVPPSTAGVAGPELPKTGGDPWPLVIFATIVLGAGLGLVYAAKEGRK